MFDIIEPLNHHIYVPLHISVLALFRAVDAGFVMGTELHVYLPDFFFAVYIVLVHLYESGSAAIAGAVNISCSVN